LGLIKPKTKIYEQSCQVIFAQVNNYFIKKWCVLGDVGNGLWNYQALMKNNLEIDIYLSP
jgi:hypothetical protein